MFDAIELTQTQVALLLEALQFVVIALRIHPKVRHDTKAWEKEMTVGFEALSSFPLSIWADTHRKLVDAAKKFDMSSLRQIDGLDANEVTDEPDPIESYPVGFNDKPEYEIDKALDVPAGHDLEDIIPHLYSWHCPCGFENVGYENVCASCGANHQLGN